MNIIGMRGAAFTASVMLECQNSPVDMLMYYDARPSCLNGMFDFYTYRPLKGYYPFYMFSDLYELKNSCKCVSDNKDVHCLAASDGESKSLMLCHYSAEKDIPSKEIILNFENSEADGEWKIFFLDENRTMEEERITVKNSSVILTLPENSVVLLKKL